MTCARPWTKRSRLPTSVWNQRRAGNRATISGKQIRRHRADAFDVHDRGTSKARRILRMRFRVSDDARPQATTLLLAAALSIALWFIPFAEVLGYPFRIFVTFIHEGGHAIAALLTGNSVQSLSVAMNASGETYTTQGGVFSQMLVSSAGYLGAMTFGAILLVLIRRAVAARIVLAGSAVLILILTTVFGLFKPMVSGSWSSLTGIPFTFFAGIALAAGLVAVAKFASARVAT